MTNFRRINEYYQKFDEWGRLDSPAGKLELKIVIEIIEKNIAANAEIFDLGGGPGRYSYELALKGYQMHLADLSPKLIEIAREKLSGFEGKDNIKSISIANAIDLSNIESEEYENVMLFGPLYHLTTQKEIDKCLKEAHRVLKPNGKIVASYIPYHCGLLSILERSFRSTDQVNSESYAKVYKEGIFNNQSNSGFQEGNYIQSSDLLKAFDENGFKKILLRSIRGIGYKQEADIIKLERERPEFYKEVMKILHQSSFDQAIIETCGHAIFIGEKV